MSVVHIHLISGRVLVNSSLCCQELSFRDFSEIHIKIIIMTLTYTFSESEMFYIFFLSSVEGLHAIVVSDRDGVPVIKGKTENLQC